MKSTNVKRNICIGLIDGIIIPLVLAAVLSRLQSDHRTVVIACLAVGVAGAITMTTGSYIEGKKYEPSEFNLTSAMVIGLAYLAGSLIVSTPFLAIPLIMDAFYVSAAFSSIILLARGDFLSYSACMGQAVELTGMCAYSCLCHKKPSFCFRPVTGVFVRTGWLAFGLCYLPQRP